MHSNDELFMSLALEQAKVGMSREGCGEVGCVIVRDGQTVASGYNEAEMQFDPTAHAEIVCLRKLGKRERSIKFKGCSLYVTLQPCTMCTSACVWAGVGRIIYGARRKDVHSMYFDTQHIDASDLVIDAYRSSVEITGGVLVAECSRLYYQPEDQPPCSEQINR